MRRLVIGITLVLVCPTLRGEGVRSLGDAVPEGVFLWAHAKTNPERAFLQPKLEAVWEAVGRLVTGRGRRRRPKVQISYLLTRESADPLARVVEEASTVGVDELFVIHLDVAPTRELLERAAFHATGLRTGVAEAIASTGASSPKDMGKVMGTLKSALAGRADMGAVSRIVKARLAG